MEITRNKKETKLTVKVPTYLEGSDKIEVGNRIIDFIKERTLQGKNVYGRKWSGKAGIYTEEYADIKGYQSPVDLELSGNMLSAMKQFKGKNKSGNIIIGFTKGTKEEKKAEGNIQGTYGRPKPIPGKARPFLDILKKDVDDIVRSFIEERSKQVEKKTKKPKEVKGRTLKQTESKPGVFTF